MNFSDGALKVGSLGEKYLAVKVGKKCYEVTEYKNCENFVIVELGNEVSVEDTNDEYEDSIDASVEDIFVDEDINKESSSAKFDFDLGGGL